MKIQYNTKLTLKDGTSILRSTAMKDYETGEEYRNGYDGERFVKFTLEDIALPKLKKTVYGVGWIDEFNSQLEALELPEGLEGAIRSEANISLNRRAGTPSSHFYGVANKVIEAINSGEEPKFENIEWNERVKQAHARLRAGITEEELTA